jgi:hypothetical protein
MENPWDAQPKSIVFEIFFSGFFVGWRRWRTNLRFCLHFESETMEELKVLELFSGIGGMHFALSGECSWPSLDPASEFFRF